MSIADWLRKLGLERYEAAFRNNEIDWEALPKLTAEDLRDLGVVLGTHRQRLLDAIISLRSEAPAADIVAVSPDTSAQTDAERRQLTVMFCDLVGSTELVRPPRSRGFARDHRRLSSRCRRSRERVRRLRRQVYGRRRAGLFRLPAGARGRCRTRGARGASRDRSRQSHQCKVSLLQTRVGIATGLVVVGDLIGHGAAEERSVVGETPNLAARLQTLAEPNTVVIAAGTRRLVGDLFDTATRGRKVRASPSRSGLASATAEASSRAGSRRCAGRR